MKLLYNNFRVCCIQRKNQKIQRVKVCKLYTFNWVRKSSYLIKFKADEL